MAQFVHTTETQDDLWDKRRTARFLGMSVKQLERWMKAGGGPRAFKFGNEKQSAVRYRPADVYSFLESCRSLGGQKAA